MNMNTRVKALVWTLCALVGACGGDVSSGTGGADASTGLVGLVSINVTPANATLVIDGATPATSVYQATGTFQDGHQEDITGRVNFRLEDQNLGAFAAAQFTSFTDRGGSTLVIAESGSVNGTTGLTLVMHQSVSDPGSTGLPTDPAGHFGGAADPARAPEIVYPNDGVLVPPNLGRLEIHFLPGSGNDLFELTFAWPARTTTTRPSRPTAASCSTTSRPARAAATSATPTSIPRRASSRCCPRPARPRSS